MSQVMSSPYYLHMRTQKQLGYVVFATPLPLLEVPGLALIVQSPSAIPSAILAESERFLNAFANTFANMSDTELAEHKQGLINRLNEKPKNLSEAAERIWKDIDINNTQFDTLSRIAQEVNTITRVELEQLLQQMLTRKNSVLVQNTGMQKSDVLPTDYIQQKNLSNLTTFPIE
jgi:secreted Zn-dependent insulinase-like peptidase